jgi:hypothetical protein
VYVLSDGISKSRLRKQLREKTEAFLGSGGEIKKCQPGETGDPADQPRAKSVFVSPSPIKKRTYVNDLVTQIDQRKRKSPAKPASKVSKGPKKKIIYDDFGEPVREVWVDE